MAMNTTHSFTMAGMLRFAMLSLILLGGASRAFAQHTPSVEISGGYQLLSPADDDDETGTLDQGWYAEGTYNANHVVSFVGQVARNSESLEASFSDEGVTVNARATARLYTLLAGVRFSDRRGARAVWFGHALVGNVLLSGRATVTGTEGGVPIEEVHFNATTSNLGVQLGGGVNLGVSTRIAIRLGADSLRVFGEDASSTALRVTAGVVVPVGRR